MYNKTREYEFHFSPGVLSISFQGGLDSVRLSVWHYSACLVTLLSNRYTSLFVVSSVLDVIGLLSCCLSRIINDLYICVLNRFCTGSKAVLNHNKLVVCLLLFGVYCPGLPTPAGLTLVTQTCSHSCFSSLSQTVIVTGKIDLSNYCM